MKEQSVLIIGVGNPYRSDDSVGILTARRLMKFKNDRLQVLEQKGDAVALMESWKDRDRAILVDAVSSGAKPGTIHRVNASEQCIPSDFFSCSTHSFGIAEAVELARSLNQLPKYLRIYGIEGKNFQPGEGLSPEVAQAMEEVINEILQQAHSINQGGTCTNNP